MSQIDKFNHNQLGKSKINQDQTLYLLKYAILFVPSILPNIIIIKPAPSNKLHVETGRLYQMISHEMTNRFH